jgi:hypothetical protein
MAVRGGQGLKLLACEWENAWGIGKDNSGEKRLDNDFRLIASHRLALSFKNPSTKPLTPVGKKSLPLQSTS